MSEQWVVGTAASCDIRVTDEYASARHAVIVRDAGRVWIADLGSTNGTRVVTADRQGVKVIGSHELHPGDTVIVGRTRIPWTQ